MKSVSVSVYKVILTVILCSLIFMVLSGCTMSQPGETASDVHRRHLRTLRINQQEMMADIDKVLLLDKPSKLTEKRIY
jgi:hypothetical protein